MALAFFPIEDLYELSELRKLRTPFMMNISKCFQTGRIEKYEMKEICKRIVQTASSYVDPSLQAKLRHIIFDAESNSTLKKEHEALGQFNMK